nr:BTB/POZ domain-containing protein 6-B-like [Lepeophtheirus salmonis]
MGLIFNGASSKNVKDTDWRNKNLSVMERMKEIYGTKIFTDVIFAVGASKTLYSGHKLVLSMASSVFTEMFEEQQDIIFEDSHRFFLSDVTPKAFDTMLKYIYTNEVNLTPENAPAALYCARKFNLVQLKKECIGFIERNWSRDNVCKLYSEAKLYDVLELTPLLKVDVVSNASEILNSPSFLDIDPGALQSILSANDLNSDELDIFQAALRWGQKQKGESLRDKLGGSLFSIRFPLLSASDFVHQVVHSQLLKTEEIIDVLECISEIKKIGNYFSTVPRIRHAMRFENNSYESKSCTHHSIRFRVNKPILVYGLGVYRPSENETPLSGTISLEMSDPRESLGMAHFKMDHRINSSIHGQYFHQPVLVKADCNVMASLVFTELKGEKSYGWGHNGKEYLNIEGVEFRFEDGHDVNHEHDTTVHHGQIPIIYFQRT